MIGKVYNIPPQPPVAEHTQEIPAGAITFGVEYRDVDPESLAATYADNDAHLAELEERSPEGGFADEGVSIHVCGADDGHEYVRFDVFDDEPHYHYIHRPDPDGAIVNNVIDFDRTAHGDMLPWTIERLRTRLPEMLTEAGGAHLVSRLDPQPLERAIGDVEALAARAQREHRSARGRH
ncbi:MAG TPA: hypothetical protein VF152_12955 [Acidimicrobiia bacterium]